MKNFTLTNMDIRQSFDSQTASRGLQYYYDDAIIDFNVYEDKGSLEVYASVMGTYEYEQEIDIFPTVNGFKIEGNCTCPVGYNCKHVVAVIYRLRQEFASPQANIVSKKAPEELWLESILSLQKKKDTNHITANDYFLVYRLFMLDYGDNELNFYKAKILKNGTLSKGSKISNDNYLRGYSYRYDFINDLDKSLAPLLYQFSHGYANNISFTDEYGAILLKKIVATDRCFFKDASHPLRFTPQKKILNFSWKEEGKVSWLASNLEEYEFLLPNTSPLLCISIKDNTLYEVETSYEKKTLHLMLNAPKMPTKSVIPLVQKVLDTSPDTILPLPKTFDIEEIEVTPVPHLYLYGEQQDNNKTMHLMQLSFSYRNDVIDEYVENFSEGTSLIVSKEGKTFRLLRNSEKEVSFREQIESLDFQYNDHPQIKAYVSFVTTGMQEAIERWRGFREEVIPKLESEGWHIEIAPSFKYNFESIESISLEGTGESERNEWFELSFSVEIAGKKLELLPIIAPLLEEFDSVEELPEHLNLEIAEGSFVHIEAKEIKPILNTIFELFDKQEGDKLIVHPYDAHLLDVNADIEWKGLKELKALSEKLKNFQGITHIEPSTNLQATLREYQSFGLDWLNFLHDFKFGGILADDMGLGKTVQTLAFLQVLKERGELSKPSLIIMPTSLIGNWKNEIKKFTPNLTFLELYGADRAEKFQEINEYDIVLTTYSLAQRDEDKYAKEHFCYIILDEAQKIKNPKTKLSVAIKSFKSSHKLALSGTPIENHLGELWSIFDFLMCGFLDNLSTFKAFFQTPIEKEYDMTRRALLNKKIAPFILRRTKDEVVEELPAKTEIVKRAVFGTKQAKLYENIRVTMESKVREAVKGKGLSRSHITILDALLKLRQVCCDPQLLKVEGAKEVKESAKLEMFLELIETLQSENKKVLVFSQFTSMLSIIEEEIKKRKIRYTKLTGATRKREEAIEAFTKGEASIFLISLKAGGVGLNLVEADTVIHYDPWWNPAVENQATDRAYRIGQDKAVFVYKLIVENSIEEKILQLQARKKSLQEGIYKGNEDKSSKFDGEELVELLRL